MVTKANLQQIESTRAKQSMVSALDKHRRRQDTEHWFSKVATITANGSGRPWAFGIAGGFVLAWLLTGPMFHFSDTWQLVMNTISSIVTFLMVFLIQNAQNRESSALQLKLDELIRVTEARNKLVGIEQLSESDIGSMRKEMKSKPK